LLKKIS